MVGAWLLILIVMLALGRATGSRFSVSITGGNTPSDHAAAFVASHLPSQAGDSAQVVFGSPEKLTMPEHRVQIDELLGRLRGLPYVTAIVSPLASGAGTQLNADRHLGFATVQFSRSGDALPNAAISRVVDTATASSRPGLVVNVAGQPVENIEQPKFGASEAIGLLAAIAILVLAFGSLIAALLPIACAVVAVATTFGVLDLLSHVLVVPTFAPELAALVGLGVGIDYALFVVTRFRAELQRGQTPHLAVVTAMSTSGRAVIFAGSTVVLSLLGLFLLGLPFIYGASLGAIVAVLLVVAASLTLLPAGLGFAGSAIDRLQIHRGSGSGSFWTRWSRLIQRQPLALAGLSLVVLLILAAPLLSMQLSFTDAGTDPANYTSRAAYDMLANGFGPGSTGPLVLAASVPQARDTQVVERLAATLDRLPDVAAVAPPRFREDDTAGHGAAAVIRVVPKTSPQSRATSSLVDQIRSKVVPDVTKNSDVRIYVGGETAASVDTSAAISRHLPYVLGFVIMLAILLLIIAFRSIVIPIVSALMTLASTGAAYGIMVAVFQWGWLGSGIDNGQTAPIDPWVPLMLFALLFGLSMDYQVFLISRIREARESGSNDRDAVTMGLASTGRVITSAAAIMVCVFGAFVLGDLRVLRLFGFAMASAVFLDATLVRMVLMPAALQLMGRANWWFPRRLDRALPRLFADRSGAIRVRDRAVA